LLPKKKNISSKQIVSASPAPKTDADELAKATFYTDCAKVKASLAFGVRVNAIVVCRAKPGC